VIYFQILKGKIRCLPSKKIKGEREQRTFVLGANFQKKILFFFFKIFWAGEFTKNPPENSRETAGNLPKNSKGSILKILFSREIPGKFTTNSKKIVIQKKLKSKGTILKNLFSREIPGHFTRN
jgi:hypothetical protein